MRAARQVSPTGAGPADARPARLLTDERLRRAAVALSVLGVVVALYLLYFKFNPTSVLCTGAGDCDTVNQSVYSQLLGIPVAALGALAYAAILGLLLLEPRSALAKAWGPLAVFGLALVGFLFSAYLTYIELFVIHAICPYCVASQVIIALILVVSSLRLGRYM
jgi:uncharacterized membrane protein